MPRRTSVAIAAFVSAVTLLAGCGGASSGGGGSNESSAAPKTELADALRALSSGSTLTTTVSLDTTSANLLHLSGESGSTPLTQHEADLISGAKITVEVTAPSGKTLKDGSAAHSNRYAMTASTGGTTYLSLIVANKTAYVKADLKDLLGLAGESSEYQTLLARTSGLPPFVKAFVGDQYVALPFSTITGLESFLKTQPGAAAAIGQIPTTAQLRTAAGRLDSAVLGDLTVARTSSGTTDQLVASVNVRKVAKDVVATIASALPALGSQFPPSSVTQVPGKTLKLNASVTGGALSKLEFDVGQLSPHHKDTLPIAATFARSGPSIAAPSGATQINFQQLLTFFAALATPTSESSSGSGSMPAPSEASSPAASK